LLVYMLSSLCFFIEMWKKKMENAKKDNLLKINTKKNACLLF
jgi:hypothetical protein